MSFLNYTKRRFNRRHTQLQESVTIRVVTRTRDSGDDITETYTDYDAYAILEPPEDGFSNENAGKLPTGSVVFYFKGNVDHLDEDNHIVYGGRSYLITDVFTTRDICIQVTTEKI